MDTQSLESSPPSTAIIVPLDGDLTPAQAALLAQLEPVIERGMAGFVEVGTALLKISDQRLYRKTHSSFSEYVEEKWNITARRAYQLCAAAEMIDALPDVNNCSHSLITNEAQARELARVEPERRGEVLKVVAERGPVTAKTIRAARATINVESEVTLGAATGKTCPPPTSTDQIVGLRPDLADVLRDDPEAKEFKPRLKTKTVFRGWWWRASKKDRAEFLPCLFTTEVVVPDKADLRRRMEWWIQNRVTEVKP